MVVIKYLFSILHGPFSISLVHESRGLGLVAARSEGYLGGNVLDLHATAVNLRTGDAISVCRTSIPARLFWNCSQQRSTCGQVMQSRCAYDLNSCSKPEFLAVMIRPPGNRSLDQERGKECCENNKEIR